MEAVSQVKAQYGLPEEPEESITSKVWSAYLAAGEYRRSQDQRNTTILDDERMELPSADQNEPVNQTMAANDFVVLVPKEDVTEDDYVVPALDEDRVEEDVFEDDQVSSVEKPNAKEQFAAAPPMEDTVQELVEDIFKDQSIEESLLFEDAPTDDAPLFPEFEFEIDFQPVQPDEEFDVDLDKPDTTEMLHHQWRPPDTAAEDLLPLDPQHDSETCQVVSFPPTVNSENFQFDFEYFGKTTCKWVNHGPNELPQLVILPGVPIKPESGQLEIFFSEYKDKSAKLRTVPAALLLLHILRNHPGSGTHAYSPHFVQSVSSCI